MKEFRSDKYYVTFISSLLPGNLKVPSIIFIFLLSRISLVNVVFHTQKLSYEFISQGKVNLLYFTSQSFPTLF